LCQHLTKVEELVGSTLVELQNTSSDLKTAIQSIILTEVQEF